MLPFRAIAAAATVCASLPLLSNCGQVDDPATASQPVAPVSVAAGDPVVVAAGDIVCGTGTSSRAPCQHAATAALLGQIDPTAILLLGDNQYEDATLADFNTYFEPTWGAYKGKMRPAAGNHEYQTPAAAGYFDYFNGPGAQSGRAGDRAKGYYSFDLGEWHLIALNSNCAFVGGCGAGSPQERWLRADLERKPPACTLAYWHHPVFSSGGHGNNSAMQALWQALYDHRADLVLAGHDHDYERFAPQTATGVLDRERGIRSFVVGTGGKETKGFPVVRANSELRSRSSFGVLKLTLHRDGYHWQFVSTPGGTLADAGSAACHQSAEPPPPAPRRTLTIRANADAHVVSSKPSQTFGSSPALQVDGAPVSRSYFRFPVSGIEGGAVVAAKLRLYAVDPSNNGGRLHRVASTGWNEAALRWSNAPAYDRLVLGKIGPVAANAWYEVDVKNQISADGTVSFALESPASDGADYRSREAGAAWAPRLVVVVE